MSGRQLMLASGGLSPWAERMGCDEWAEKMLDGSPILLYWTCWPKKLENYIVDRQEVLVTTSTTGLDYR